MSPQIMVPLDGSAFSEQGLRYAQQVASHMRGTLHLVRVNAPDPLTAEAFFFNVQPAGVRHADEQYLARIRDNGVWQLQTRAVTAVLDGPVVDALSAYIHSQRIDFVIMTTHGRGGLSRAWLGSVADQLVRRVNIPILLLRPQKGEIRIPGPRFDLDHILIPLDGSHESELAIEPALALGRLTSARFTLLQIVPPLTVIPVTEVVPLPIQQAEHDELRAGAERYLDQVAQRLRGAGHEVDTEVVIQPQCAAGILEQAVSTQVNLIVMATHGRSGLQRLALGSVADKVLRGTSVPLLLLRPNPGEVALTVSA